MTGDEDDVTGRPTRPGVAAPVAEAQQPTEDFGYLQTAGCRLAYLDLGGGRADQAGRPPVMLVHGMFSAAWSWTRFARELVASGRRVIVPELRGHGHSGPADSYRFEEFADDLVHLLDHLEVESVDLVGHSLGGHVATLIAEREPARVRRLVVEDAPPPPVPGDSYKGVGLGALPMRARMLVLGVLVFRYRWLARTIDIPMSRQVLAEFRRPDPQWWARLSTITAPTLLIAGGGTSHVPLRRLRVIQQLIPECRLVSYDVGHRVHLTIPDHYRELVEEFLS